MEMKSRELLEDLLRRIVMARLEANFNTNFESRIQVAVNMLTYLEAEIKKHLELNEQQADGFKE